LDGEGAATGDKVNCVPIMLYANDLALMAKSPAELQKMLDKLRVYAARKGLIVNTAKTEVVHFNSKSRSSSLPIFTSPFLGRTGSSTWACLLIST